MNITDSAKNNTSWLWTMISLLTFIVVSCVGAWAMSTMGRVTKLEADKAVDEQSLATTADHMRDFESQLTALNAKMDVIVDLDTKLLTKK